MPGRRDPKRQKKWWCFIATGWWFGVLVLVQNHLLWVVVHQSWFWYDILGWSCYTIYWVNSCEFNLENFFFFFQIGNIGSIPTSRSGHIIYISKGGHYSVHHQICFLTWPRIWNFNFFVATFPNMLACCQRPVIRPWKQAKQSAALARYAYERRECGRRWFESRYYTRPAKTYKMNMSVKSLL